VPGAYAVGHKIFCCFRSICGQLSLKSPFIKKSMSYCQYGK
jgi:hypothetical protein